MKCRMDNTGGSGIEGWIQPRCVCGWTGRKHYAHNDYQHSNATEEFERHWRECMKGQKNMAERLRSEQPC